MCEQSSKLVGVARVLLFSGALCAMMIGCSTSQRGDMSLVSDQDHVVDRRTFVKTDQGVEDRGIARYRESTERFVQLFPLSGVDVDQQGRLISFTTAAVSPGLSVGDTLMEYVVFDRKGQLVAGRVSDLEAQCSVLRRVNPDGTITTTCRRVNCVSPSFCVLTYIVDPETGAVTIQCDCTVPT